MQETYILEFLRDLINKYLNSEINKIQMIRQLSLKISISEISEYENELLRECYSAIFHMDEIYCSVSDNELIYYLSCLEGKQLFSRIKRDKINSGEIGYGRKEMNLNK